eukprot:900576-Amphidinium_carterae.2
MRGADRCKERSRGTGCPSPATGKKVEAELAAARCCEWRSLGHASLRALASKNTIGNRISRDVRGLKQDWNASAANAHIQVRLKSAAWHGAILHSTLNESQLS